MPQVVLVDQKDNARGVMEKLEAHRKGVLHRAFSVFIFNDNQELLLQQRAENKYHSPGLWTNTCCSHPAPGESTKEAAHRRIKEEMGFDCPLEKKFDFIYRSELNRGLIEHEFDHVFFGTYNGAPKINEKEVKAWKYVPVSEIKKELQQSPEQYSAWIRIIFDNVVEHLKKRSDE